MTKLVLSPLWGAVCAGSSARAAPALAALSPLPGTAPPNRRMRGGVFTQWRRDGRGNPRCSMSRSLWRCRNRACPVEHGAVLGRLASERRLVLQQDIQRLAVYFDTGRASVWCPACGVRRDFFGASVQWISVDTTAP